MLSNQSTNPPQNKFKTEFNVIPQNKEDNNKLEANILVLGKTNINFTSKKSQNVILVDFNRMF